MNEKTHGGCADIQNDGGLQNKPPQQSNPDFTRSVLIGGRPRRAPTHSTISRLSLCRSRVFYTCPELHSTTTEHRRPRNPTLTPTDGRRPCSRQATTPHKHLGALLPHLLSCCLPEDRSGCQQFCRPAWNHFSKVLCRNSIDRRSRDARSSLRRSTSRLD